MSRPTLLMLDTLKQTCRVIITIHNVDLEVLPKDKSKEAVGDTHPMELNMVSGNAEDFGWAWWIREYTTRSRVFDVIFCLNRMPSISSFTKRTPHVKFKFSQCFLSIVIMPTSEPL